MPGIRSLKMEAVVVTKRKLKHKIAMGKRASIGAELSHLDVDKTITTDPSEYNKRRTLQLTKRNNSWGFTLQTYGINHKRTCETEIMTYVDYVDMGGPAWIAGMRRGDVILSVNGEKVGEISHKHLVNKIRQAETTLRLVVLFEDCCRKVDLHERYIKLKSVLKSKYQELQEIEKQELEILNNYRLTKGLNRMDQMRQSILSDKSSSNDSWDAYSLISSPAGLKSTGQYDHSQWSSATSLKSYSMGDNSDIADDDYVYIDSDSENEGLKMIVPSPKLKTHRSESNLNARNGATVLPKLSFREIRLSDSKLYRRSIGSENDLRRQRSLPRVKDIEGSATSLRDEVFEEENVVNGVCNDDQMNGDNRDLQDVVDCNGNTNSHHSSVEHEKDLTLKEDKVFYAGENGSIIVPKICIDGETVFTTLEHIDTSENLDNMNEDDKISFEHKVVAMEIAREMAKFEGNEKVLSVKSNSDENLPDTFAKSLNTLKSDRTGSRSPSPQQSPGRARSQKLIDSNNTTKNDSKYSPKSPTKVLPNIATRAASMKKSRTRGSPHLSRKIAPNLPSMSLTTTVMNMSPKSSRNNMLNLGGSLPYDQLKSSIPEIRVSFHTDECEVIYINDKDETTKL